MWKIKQCNTRRQRILQLGQWISWLLSLRPQPAFGREWMRRFSWTYGCCTYNFDWILGQMIAGWEDWLFYRFLVLSLHDHHSGMRKQMWTCRDRGTYWWKFSICERHRQSCELPWCRSSNPERKSSFYQNQDLLESNMRRSGSYNRRWWEEVEWGKFHC